MIKVTDLKTLQSVAQMIALDYPHLLEDLATIAEAGGPDKAWQEASKKQTLTLLRAKRLLEVNYPEESALRELYTLLAGAYAMALLDPASPAESFPSGDEVVHALVVAGLGA